MIACSRKLRSCCLKGIPVCYLFLNHSRIISSENLRSHIAAVNHDTGTALPGKPLQYTVGICNNILGILVLVRQIRIRNPQISYGHGVLRIHILQRIIRLNQKNVDLVICSCIRLTQKGSIQIILVRIIIAGCNIPLYRHIPNCAGGSVNLRISRIMICKSGLEFFVPAVDVQNFSFVSRFRRFRIRCLRGWLRRAAFRNRSLRRGLTFAGCRLAAASCQHGSDHGCCK